MIKLNPAVFSPASGQQIEKFKQFLDRNFPGWRSALIQESDTLCIWEPCADNQRHAKLWEDYVEIWDDTTNVDGPDNLLRHRICSAAGDETPVAVWHQGD
ncbi:hypothetical protein [Anatilimnocola floriformis]|uniref:hypothetical protein n=1 Tax=Anatilimnocola floriformis TaxID=2948575 RepID=UPI0020C43AD4|nr:hypothetical protein [Anatilimnocola floriformis]